MSSCDNIWLNEWSTQKQQSEQSSINLNISSWHVSIVRLSYADLHTNTQVNKFAVKNCWVRSNGAVSLKFLRWWYSNCGWGARQPSCSFCFFLDAGGCRTSAGRRVLPGRAPRSRAGNTRPAARLEQGERLCSWVLVRLCVWTLQRRFCKGFGWPALFSNHLVFVHYRFCVLTSLMLARVDWRHLFAARDEQQTILGSVYCKSNRPIFRSTNFNQTNNTKQAQFEFKNPDCESPSSKYPRYDSSSWTNSKCTKPKLKNPSCEKTWKN